MISSSVGSTSIVKFLLDSGLCDPNHANQNKQRPLHYAASRNHPEVARMLLNAGAQANASDIYGSTALHRAASKGNLKLCDLLLTNEKSKANVNAADSEGNTPL